MLAVSEKTSYWQDIEQEERLLFSDKDLANPHSSRIFAELKKLSPEIVYFTIELEKFCQESNIEILQPLENLVTAYTGSKVSRDFVPNATPDLSSPIPIPMDLNNPVAWNIFTPNNISSKSVNVGSSGTWDKLDTNSSNAWDKFDGNQPSIKDAWDKFDQSGQTEQPKSTTDENIWSKFDDIWNKMLKSVSSIWNRFAKWFN